MDSLSSMDFQSLPRKDLQALCKKNGIPANITNVAMVQKLSSMEVVLGIEEIFGESASQKQRTPEKGTENQKNTTSASVNVQSIPRALRTTRGTATKQQELSCAVNPICTRKITSETLKQENISDISSSPGILTRKGAPRTAKKPVNTVDHVDFASDARRVSRRISASSKMKKVIDTERMESEVSVKKRYSTRRLTTSSTVVGQDKNEKMEEGKKKGVKIEAINLNYEEDLENVTDLQKEILDDSAGTEDGPEKVDSSVKGDTSDEKIGGEREVVEAAKEQQDVLDMSVDEHSVEEKPNVFFQLETEKEDPLDNEVEKCEKEDASAKEESNVSVQIESYNLDLESNVENDSEEKLNKSKASVEFETDNLNDIEDDKCHLVSQETCDDKMKEGEENIEKAVEGQRVAVDNTDDSIASAQTESEVKFEQITMNEMEKGEEKVEKATEEREDVSDDITGDSNALAQIESEVNSEQTTVNEMEKGEEKLEQAIEGHEHVVDISDDSKAIAQIENEVNFEQITSSEMGMGEERVEQAIEEHKDVSVDIIGGSKAVAHIESEVTVEQIAVNEMEKDEDKVERIEVHEDVSVRIKDNSMVLAPIEIEVNSEQIAVNEMKRGQVNEELAIKEQEDLSVDDGNDLNEFAQIERGEICVDEIVECKDKIEERIDEQEAVSVLMESNNLEEIIENSESELGVEGTGDDKNGKKVMEKQKDISDVLIENENETNIHGQYIIEVPTEGVFDNKVMGKPMKEEPRGVLDVLADNEDQIQIDLGIKRTEEIVSENQRDMLDTSPKKGDKIIACDNMEKIEGRTLETVVCKIDEIVEKLTDAVSICTKSSALKVKPQETSALGESVKILEASIVHYEDNETAMEEKSGKKNVSVYEDKSEILVEKVKSMETAALESDAEKTRAGKEKRNKENRKGLTELSLRQLRKQLKLHASKNEPLQIETSRVPLQALSDNNSSANLLGLL